MITEWQKAMFRLMQMRVDFWGFSASFQPVQSTTYNIGRVKPKPIKLDPSIFRPLEYDVIKEYNKVAKSKV